MAPRAAAAALLLLLLPALVSAQVRVRQPFRTLMSAPEYAKQRDLLILALQHLQQMDAEDPDSFYQIGSIHGMPAAAYAGVENLTSPYEANSTRWLGYCDHAGVIFPTWHRPYVLQLELSIRRAAMRIAEQFEYQFGLNVYKEAAETLSWPYWDWAANEPHPAELTDLTILVRVPPRMKWQRIANPFYSYTFQKETSTGASYTEAQEIPFWSPEGSPTYRYPFVDNSTNTGYMSNQTGQIDTFNNMHNLTHDWVMNLFNINSWTCFADRGSQLSTPFCPLQSLESVHNWVHLYIGGYAPVGLGHLTGHMSLLQTAGFDPAFFLHHANVDRLLALWQVFFPGVWVIPGVSAGGTFMYDKGQPLNQTSPLYPFKFQSGASEGEFFSSNDVVSTRALGYTYPELEPQPSWSDLFSHLVDLYGPVRTGWRWYIYFNCTSTSPVAASGFTISADFIYNGTTYTLSTTQSPTLMSIGTMQVRTSVNTQGQTVLATELTRAFTNAGIPFGSIPPINGMYENGPAEVPLPATAFPATCQLTNGTVVSPCTCTKYMLWGWDKASIDPSMASPYSFYGTTVTPGLEGWGGTYTS